MSGWTVPLSSSPPATPDSRRQQPSNYGDSFGSFSNPSTTPAGPPPSSTKTFTPAGPPPSTIFGSSQIGSTNTHLHSKNELYPTLSSKRNSNSLSSKTSHPKTNPSSNSNQFTGFSKDVRQSNNTFTVPSSSPQFQPNDDDLDVAGSSEDAEGEDDYDDEERDAEGSDEGSMEVDSDAENHPIEDGAQNGSRHQLLQSSGDYDWAQHGLSVMESKLGGMKASNGAAEGSYSLSRGNRLRPARKSDSAIPTIAKDLAKRIGPAKLDEPDELILETEELVSQFYQDGDVSDEQELVTQAALTAVPEALAKLWQSCCNRNKENSGKEDELIGIGPGDDEPPLLKATFLSTLLLQLHHPPAAKGKQAFAKSKSNRASFPSSFSSTPFRPMPYPEALLHWLEGHHNPYRTAINDLMSCHPNPTAHLNYWDIVFSSTLRGKILDVIRVFRESDFTQARTAREDGQTKDGYHGLQLGSITRVINRAIQVLETCPALQDDDWHVEGNDWMIFRKRVEQAIADLATFAEGRDRDLDPEESTFEAENFGIRSASTALSRSARRAESRVPWTIYQNLKALYGILLGGTTEILSFAQDWVEATIGLTVWWDGEDDDEIVVGSLAMTHRSLRRSQSRIPRSIDENAAAAYQRRLAYAFDRVTDNSDEEAFQINSMNPVEVGLASIFEGNVEGVLGILQRWSIPIAAAVMEVATQGGWFVSQAGGWATDGFDQSDLMVLSYGQPEKGLSRDGILVDYAHMLFDREILKDPRTSVTKEGWELSIEIITRLDSDELANKQVGDLLEQLPLLSDQRVDKLLNICSVFGLDRDACRIAEKYADSVAENSDRYGTALVYYARAHSSKKVKHVLDLLISLSLVESLAYPPLSSIDPNLKALVFTPKASLTQLSGIDSDAAELLQTYVSGYATIRKFYDLRDEETNLAEGQKPSLRPFARKKAAAAALLAVIASAVDNIHGGLYDKNRRAIVQVDGLLALLGEAMVFINQPTRILTLPQLLSLLRAIEDLETVTSRVYAQCEDCFQSTLAAAHGSQQLPPPMELLKKSISSLTSSSGFSLVGSSMLDGESGNGKGGSGLLGKGKAREKGEIKRGWDWRMGLSRDAKGGDVLRILRLGLAKEVARAWIEGDEV